MLSESAVKAAEIRSKSYRIKGEDGLFVEVRPSGSKVFRVRYWSKGRDTLTTIGEWPYVTVRDAKEKAFEMRRLLTTGVDPRAVAQYEAESESRRARTFGEIAAGWMEKKRQELASAKNIALAESRLDPKSAGTFMLMHVKTG